jgi:hypothetical protein
MKKQLIAAALFAVTAVTPSFACVLGAFDLPGRASGLVCAVASPIFWHVYEEVLTRVLARFTTQSAAQPPAQAETAVCAFVQIVLARAIDGSLTAAQESHSVSIPSPLVRRVVERRFAATHTARALRHI